MRLIAIALCLTLAAAAQDQPDFKTEFKDLEGAYTKAQQDFYAAVRAAQTDQERAKVYREQNPARPYLAKFQDLAKRADKDPAAAGALGWVFTLASQVSDANAAREAAERLLADFPDAKQLASVASQLQYGGRGATWSKGWLMSVAEKTGSRDAKVSAMFSLGCILMSEPGAEQKTDGRRFFEVIIKNYGDTPYAKRADCQIFELDRLQIGKEAPDFEVTDVDGQKFKLSDYRGKVVVVDFWGFW